MPKKIPTDYSEDDNRSSIRKAQKKESKRQKPIGNVVEVSKDTLKGKGSGGIDHEAKEYIKELKKRSYHAKKGKK